MDIKTKCDGIIASNCCKKLSQNEKRLCQHITIAVHPTSPDKSIIEQSLIHDVFSEDSKSEIVVEDTKAIKTWTKRGKYFVIFCIWLVCCCTLMSAKEKVQEVHQLSIQNKTTTSYVIHDEPVDGKMRVSIGGALLPLYYANLSTHWIHVWVRMIETYECPKKLNSKNANITNTQNITEIWKIPIVTEGLIGRVPEVKIHKVFTINDTLLEDKEYNHYLELRMSTNLGSNFPISLEYNAEPINTDDGIIYAALVLLGLYSMIIFEMVHRTVATIFACVLAVSVLAALNAKPTMAEIVSWIDVDTLLLLFSMMVLVTVISETGVFDYMSVQAYKFTGGRTWPLINALCLITAILSCFLDNVTTALLITPVTIRLSEVMKLNPVPVLICTIIFSNVGGAITPIGDPPNVIIASNPDVLKSGVNFITFTMHMGIGALLAYIVVYVQLRYYYKDTKSFKYSEPREVQELKGKIAVWKRTVASVSSYTRNEDIIKETMMKGTAHLVGKLKTTVNNISATDEEYSSNLVDLQRQYPIKDKMLLVKSGGTLILVIIVLFLQSIPSLNKLGMAWTALLGALLLLLLYGKDVEGIFSRIEWSTLLFFAALFILMEALSKLGLIEWIGRQTYNVIMSVDQESRLTVAIVLILWVSGMASAFVDNLPLTTMMIRIATDLSNNHELNLPLQPLIWALSFGACLGANGSLFGSSSNIICAGVAEQHGYRFSFVEYFKIGVPIMLSTMTVITFYLILCHVVLEWNY